MHPLHHAKSSAKRLGGEPEDYLAIHSWMDESKSAFCSPMHRAYRHHLDILPDLVDVFGTHLPNHPSITMASVLRDHLMEDCKGTTPSLRDWMMALKPQRWMVKNKHMSTQLIAEAIATRFGGEAQEYMAICEYMDEGKKDEMLADWRYRAWRWHSFATFDAERKFGVSFKNSAGRNVIVRYVAEKHIQCVLGRLPTLQDWYSHITFSPFMAGNHVIAGAKTMSII
jgi:hypothetical protein